MPGKRIGHLLWAILLISALFILGGGLGLTLFGEQAQALRQWGPLSPLSKASDLVLSRVGGQGEQTATASDGRTSGNNRKVAPLKSSNYLRVSGNKIVDAQGREVKLTGVNWFGMETSTFAPHGLWSRNWEDMLDQVVDLGFNTIRLPYTNEMLDPASVPNGINWELNPDLKGLTPIQIMDKIVVGAGERGLKVILDRHRPSSDAQSDLWYTSRYNEERWINDWKMLAGRYSGNDTVIGVDLHNEPKGQATWGTGNVSTDWRLAAERAGNAVLSANPNLLIIVEGIDNYKGNGYWWGGNLMGVRDFPVRLSLPDRLVYSVHDYGPGVYNQNWFTDASFPTNLPKVWNDNWFYIVKEGIAPVYVGEFGGRSVGRDTEGIWQNALTHFLKDNGLSYTYWSLNPNSGDTGGILADDWQTPLKDKLAMLAEYQSSLLGNGAPTKVNGKDQAAAPARPQPTPIRNPFDVPNHQATERERNGALSVAFHSSRPDTKTNELSLDLRVTNNGAESIDLKAMDLRYWFKAEDLGGKPQLFTVDWATVNSGSIRSEFVPLAIAGQSHFLRLTFADSAGSLGSGRSLEIKGRIRKEDWSDYDQSNDYSFTRSKDYVDWDHITVYVKGDLLWGVEPSAAPPPK